MCHVDLDFSERLVEKTECKPDKIKKERIVGRKVTFVTYLLHIWHLLFIGML
jgi:hypothetical protein